MQNAGEIIDVVLRQCCAANDSKLAEATVLALSTAADITLEYWLDSVISVSLSLPVAASSGCLSRSAIRVLHTWLNDLIA